MVMQMTPIVAAVPKAVPVSTEMMQQSQKVKSSISDGEQACAA